MRAICLFLGRIRIRFIHLANNIPSPYRCATHETSQEQNHVFEEVIGGANEDVLYAAKEVALRYE
jgi:hypothetical protein